MFFVLSKTLGYLLLPTNFLIAIGFVGAILMATRFASLGRKLVIASVLLLVICGLSPLGKVSALSAGAALSAMGRRRAARLMASSFWADRSILIFPSAHDTPVVRGAPDRIITAAALARRYPNARVVFSGGSAEPDFERCQGSRFRRRHLRKPRHRQIAADHGTAIAQHPGECRIHQGAGHAEGRRAMAAGHFGLSHAALGRAVPKGGICGRALSRRLAGRRPRRPDVAFTTLRIEGLARTDIAVREWMGLIAYRLTGRIDELLPGPAPK